LTDSDGATHGVGFGAVLNRYSDTIYRENGDVLQTDHNAALNVLVRLDDPDIGRFTPHGEVRRILLARSPAQLRVHRLELGVQARQPSADESSSAFIGF
jgi:hypothetical protein